MLRDEVAQLKKYLNPVDQCGGTTTKGGACRNKCVNGTKFCRKHTIVPQEPLKNIRGPMNTILIVYLSSEKILSGDSR